MYPGIAGDDIISFLNQKTNKYSNAVYVIWDEGTLPIIQTNLDKVFEAIDDVTAVSFDIWIFSEPPLKKTYISH
jgi:hypothetical protein